MYFSDSAVFARMWLTELARGRLFVATNRPPKLGSLVNLLMEIQINESQVLFFTCTVSVISRRGGRGPLPAGFGCELEAVPAWEQPKLELALSHGIEKQEVETAEPVVVAGDRVADERRRFKRIAFGEEVLVHFGLFVAPARAHDLSQGGLGIEVEETIYSGTELSLRMALPDGGPPIVTLATTSWARPHGNLMLAGLQFQNPTTAALERIKSCVNDTPTIYDPPT